MVKLILTLVALIGLQNYNAQCASLDDVNVNKIVNTATEVSIERLETLSIAPLAVKPTKSNKYNQQFCNLSKPIVKKRKLRNWNLC